MRYIHLCLSVAVKVGKYGCSSIKVYLKFYGGIHINVLIRPETTGPIKNEMKMNMQIFWPLFNQAVEGDGFECEYSLLLFLFYIN